MEEICLTPEELQNRLDFVWWLALLAGCVGGYIVGGIITYIRATRKLDRFMEAMSYPEG